MAGGAAECLMDPITVLRMAIKWTEECTDDERCGSRLRYLTENSRQRKSGLGIVRRGCQKGYDGCTGFLTRRGIYKEQIVRVLSVVLLRWKRRGGSELC